MNRRTFLSGVAFAALAPLGPRRRARVWRFVPTPADSLIDAGRRWNNGKGVLSLVTGKQDPILQAAAEAHARYQAARGVQGHQQWDRRFRELNRALPGYTNIREIAAESWPGESEQRAAWEMFNSWRQSPGHWRSANGRCAIWGYSMAYSPRKRTWYACGILADRR